MLGAALGGGLLVAGAALPGGAAWATCVASGPDFALLCENGEQGRLELGPGELSVQIGPNYTIGIDVDSVWSGGISAVGSGDDGVRIHLEDGDDEGDDGDYSVEIRGGQTSGEVDAINVHVEDGDVEITADSDVFIAPGFDEDLWVYGDGIHVEGTGGIGTTVRIDTAATIDADHHFDFADGGDGIDIYFETADIEIRNSGSIAASRNGMSATVGSGTVLVQNTGDIAIDSDGILYGAGIFAVGNVPADEGLAVLISDGAEGYFTIGEFSVVVSNTGNITANTGIGISAFGNAGNVLVLNGLQTTVGDDHTVTLVSDENGVPITDATATIDASGQGDGLGGSGIVALSDGGQVVVVNGGVVKAGFSSHGVTVVAWDDATVLNLAGGKIYGGPLTGFAVYAASYTEDVVVSNAGDIYGAVWLQAFDGVAFDNFDDAGYGSGRGGTFHASGTSGFGGDGRFDNTFGTVKVDFGHDPVTGEPFEVLPGYPPFANLYGLASFDNGRGTIDLSGNGGGATLGLGETGNQFDDDFTFYGSDEDGRRGSLVVDLVFEEDDGSIHSYTDSLQVSGSVEGVTEVTLNVLSYGARLIPDDDLGFIALAANNDSGAVTDDLRNDAGNFVLKNVIGDGFFQYSLNYTIENYTEDGYLHLWYLSSDVGARSYEMPQMMTASAELWHAGAASWADRAGDLRNAIDSEGTALGYAGDDKGPAVAAIGALTDPRATGVAAPGVWARAVGGYISRDTENSSTVLADGYDQTFWGLEGGVDGAAELSGGGIVRIGVLAGYTGTHLGFDGTGSSADISGPSVGAYAGLSQGGAYADVLGKVDFLSVEYASQGSEANVDGLSYGGVIEAGYRIGSATGTYVTPKASLAYVHTEIDDFDIFGTAVDFEGGDSLRAKAGVEVGTRLVSASGTVMTPFVTAAVGNEFEGDNTVGLESGSSLSVSDDASGLFGEAGAGVVVTTGKTSVYLKGDGRFAEDLYGATGRAGVRLSW